MVFVFLFFLSVQNFLASDCHYYKNCGKWAREPYHVVYTYPGEYWGYEKQIRGSEILLKQRELSEGEEYRNPLPEIDQALQFRVADVFSKSRRVYSHVQDLIDEKGKVYRLRVEWAGWHDTRSRSFVLLKKRKEIQYLKVTVDGNILFHVEDIVDHGLYEYEDFFRLGERKYKFIAGFQNHSDSYSFSCSVVAAY